MISVLWYFSSWNLFSDYPLAMPFWWPGFGLGDCFGKYCVNDAAGKTDGTEVPQEWQVGQDSSPNHCSLQERGLRTKQNPWCVRRVPMTELASGLGQGWEQPISTDGTLPEFQHPQYSESAHVGLPSLVQCLGLWEKMLALHCVILETEYKRLMFLLFYSQEERKKITCKSSA